MGTFEGSFRVQRGCEDAESSRHPRCRETPNDRKHRRLPRSFVLRGPRSSLDCCGHGTSIVPCRAKFNEGLEKEFICRVGSCYQYQVCYLHPFTMSMHHKLLELLVLRLCLQPADFKVEFSRKRCQKFFSMITVMRIVIRVMLLLLLLMMMIS